MRRSSDGREFNKQFIMIQAVESLRKVWYWVKAVKFFMSVASRRWSAMKRLKVSVEWSFLFPLWWEETLPLLKRYALNWSRTTLSHILEAIASSDRGRLFEATSWSPSLSKGITSANFHASGYYSRLERRVYNLRKGTPRWQEDNPYKLGYIFCQGLETCLAAKMK